jgi:hypothetical protein
MSVFIYLFHERIICWTPQSVFSKPASAPNVQWYSIHGTPPMPYNEMVTQGNIGYTLKKGFFTVEGTPPSDWSEREDRVKHLQLIAALNTVTTTHKARYTDNAIGQPLADALLLDEIREYRTTNSMEHCPILTSLLETSTVNLTPDALVTKLWLRYESYRNVIAYLNRLEFNIEKLLAEKAFDQVTEILNGELDKIRV